MIGSLDPTTQKATIVGGGLSGLLIAYALKKKGFQVEILESQARSGGLIQTLSTPFGLVEKAAHSLLVTPETLILFQELKIPLEPVQKNSRARYIYRDGKMRKMPLRFLEILKTAFTFFSAPRKKFSSETGSLAEWGNIYLGFAATQFLLSPFVTGIFATVPDRLLAKIAFPKLVPASSHISLFRHFRSFPKNARPQMMAPRDGMESLVKALEKDLASEIKLNHPVTDLPKETNLILTTPASVLSKLIQKEDLPSAEKLLQVVYAPLITVTCFYPKSAFPKEPRGVGVLIPRGEGLRILGCLFNSSSFPNRTQRPEHVSLTVMYGGTEDASALLLNDLELRTLIHSELRTLLGATTESEHLEITRWERAIPVYSRELFLAQESLKLGLCAKPGTLIFSNFSKEVSIRGLINASLHM